MVSDLSDLRWRKSSHSGGEGGQCVEVAHTKAVIRDSKNPAATLGVDVAGLLAAVKGNQLR